MEDDKNTYIAYVKAKTEKDIDFDASDAYMTDGNDYSTGSIRFLLYPTGLTIGYRQKTLELFKRLQDLGVTPHFVFTKTEYNDQIKSIFPDLWQRAFG